MMKRILRIVLVVLLLVPFVACQTKKAPEQSFEDYTKEFVINYYGPSDFGINFDFENPEDYGIVRGLYAFNGYVKDDFAVYMEALKEEIAYLKRYDYKSFSEEEKWTYDVILDYLQREATMENHFYFEAKGFGSINGVNNNLPLLLDEFIFNDKQDVDSYINLLITTPIMMESYLSLELERQEKGFGLAQATVDAIIEQCDAILETTDYFLEESFNRKIDNVDFLSPEEKAEYKQMNKEHLYGEYYGAYRTVKEGLSTVDASRYDEMPLAKLEGGPDYYQALIKRQIGVDMTPREIISFLESDIQKTVTAYLAIYNEYGDTLFDSYDYFPSASSVEEVVDHLYEAFQEDFPNIEKSDIDIKTVDKSMQDSFSPAAYLITKYDTPVSSREVILINGTYNDYSFTTYAHEGYPGHLYQNVYYKSLNLNMANYILSNIGYSEGWAVYAEQYALKYSELPDEVKEFEYLNNRFNNAIMCLFELKIHYEGFNKEEFYEFASEYFAVDREWSDNFYDLILEIPSYCLYYNFSYLLMEDAKSTMQSAYGESFTDYQFHEFVLRHGNGSIGLLLEKLQEELKK